jgi:hypothetical protein
MVGIGFLLMILARRLYVVTLMFLKATFWISFAPPVRLPLLSSPPF